MLIQVEIVKHDGVHGRELWVTDGADTQLVVDANPGQESSLPQVVLP